MLIGRERVDSHDHEPGFVSSCLYRVAAAASAAALWESRCLPSAIHHQLEWTWSSRARKAIFSEILVDVIIQTLLMHRGVATRHGLGDGFLVGGVHFFLTTKDTRILVRGKILDGGTVVRTTPLFLGDVVVVLRGEPSVCTG